ncbi:MAG TPA: hypothetical protein VGD56_05295 [Gemmatirosa sp.]
MPPEPISLAVVNARVWTGDPRRPWADAVVVRGDRLAFVGSAAEAGKLVRGVPDARVVDAGGQFLAPPADAPGVLRTGEPADFVLVGRDPTGANGGTAEARVVLAVHRGRVVVDASPVAHPLPPAGDAGR